MTPKSLIEYALDQN